MTDEKTTKCNQCENPLQKGIHTCGEGLNIVDLSQAREKVEKEKQQLPPFILDELKILLEKAQNQKLKSLVINYVFEEEETETEEEDDNTGGTIFFNKRESILEILGTIEIMKATAFDILYRNRYEESEE